jgi:hypothetical protein
MRNTLNVRCGLRCQVRECRRNTAAIDPVTSSAGFNRLVQGGLLSGSPSHRGGILTLGDPAHPYRRAHNEDDHYLGFKTYTFLFRGEKIVDARLPLPGDEMT